MSTGWFPCKLCAWLRRHVLQPTHKWMWMKRIHYLVKCATFSSDWRYVRFSKLWWIWNEPVVGWHWWLWKELVVMCAKWNVRQAKLQQMFKVTTFCTDTCFQSFFATDQLYHLPCCAEICVKSQISSSNSFRDIRGSRIYSMKRCGPGMPCEKFSRPKTSIWPA